MRALVASFAGLVIAVALCGTAIAQTGDAAPRAETSDTDLAKKTQNPVADLISVPFQSNFNFNTGPEDKINPSFFLSPAGSKEFIWGFGATFTFPTATSRELRRQVEPGATAVALTMQGPTGSCASRCSSSSRDRSDP